MATSHLALLKSKKSNLLQTSKREVATLVSVNKIPLAEIKIESIIQQEDLIIAIEILGLHCDRILNRVSQIASQPKCPEDIFVSIATVIYCSTRLPIPEFHSIATQMALKYSKEWVMPLNDRKQYVDPKVLERIDVNPPSKARLAKRLADLAAEFKLDYSPEVEDVAPAVAAEAPVVAVNSQKVAVEPHEVTVDAVEAPVLQRKSVSFSHQFPELESAQKQVPTKKVAELVDGPTLLSSESEPPVLKPGSGSLAAEFAELDELANCSENGAVDASAVVPENAPVPSAGFDDLELRLQALNR